jgi:hypothetical protein
MVVFFSFFDKFTGPRGFGTEWPILKLGVRGI